MASIWQCLGLNVSISLNSPFGTETKILKGDYVNTVVADVLANTRSYDIKHAV